MRPTDCQGFVLCGGQSRRMGRDKALLPWDGDPLVVHIARIVENATGAPATLVGPSQRYSPLGLRIIEDAIPNQGPLGGIIAALASATAERCLIVACDMPWLDPDTLRRLVQHVSSAEVVAARGDFGIEPLCAVYRRACLPVLRQALAEEQRTVHKVLERLTLEEWPLANPRVVLNANTPADWALVEAKN